LEKNIIHLFFRDNTLANATAILAAFTPKAPVEPTAPTSSQDSFADGDNFKNILKDAVNSKSEQESRFNDSKQSDVKQSDIKQTDVNQSDKSGVDKTINNSNENKFSTNDSNETVAVASSQDIATNTGQALSDEKALIKDLENLGLSREQIDSLLQAIKSGDATQASAFIQNLIAPELGNLNAGSSANDNDLLSPQAITERFQQNKDQAIELVKKLQLSQSEQEALADAKGQDKLSLQKPVENSKPDFFTQLGLKSNKAESSKGSESQPKRAEASAKQAEVPKSDLDPRITIAPDAGEKKSSQDQGNREPLIDLKIQGSQFSSSQSRDGTVGLKGPEGMKATLEAPPTVIQANGESSSKATEGVKSFISETFSGRGPADTKIVQQIVEKFSIRSNGDQNNIKLRLDPPSLGSVRMNISTVGDSVRTTIVVESHAVKQAIENNISQLRDSMSAQGLDAEQINVTVGGEGFNDNANNNESFAKRDTASHISFESFLGNDVPETSYVPPANPALTHFVEEGTSLSVLA
jgi:flagellar hook-length control protein FliK